jgi:hypothetical protein
VSEQNSERIESLVGISPRRLAILEEKAAILEELMMRAELVRAKWNDETTPMTLTGEVRFAGISADAGKVIFFKKLKPSQEPKP